MKYLFLYELLIVATIIFTMHVTIFLKHRILFCK